MLKYLHMPLLSIVKVKFCKHSVFDKQKLIVSKDFFMSLFLDLFFC